MHTLRELRAGDRGVVVGLMCGARSVRRLADMGLTPGTAVEVLRTAPLGDPIVLSLRGCRLAIRRRDAAAVLLR